MMDTSKNKQACIKSHLLKVLLAAVFVLGLTIFVNSADVQAATKATNLKQGYVKSLSEQTNVAVTYTTSEADYMYYRIGTSKSNVGTATTKSYVYSHAFAQDNASPYMIISGLSAGKTYYVEVGSASVGDTDIKWSEPFEVVTAPNAAPKNLKQTKAEKKAITVSWGSVTGANVYVVNTLKSGSQKWSSDKTTTANKLRITGLSQGSAYGVSVCAGRKSSSGYIAYGYDVQSTKYYLTIPKKPTAPVLTERYTQSGKAYVGVKQQSGVTGYQFQIYDMSTKKTVITSKSTSYMKTISSSKLKQNHIYGVRVRSYIVNTNYHSEWSSYSYFASQKKGSIRASRAINGMKLSWSKVGGAKKYAVYLSTSLNGTYKKVTTTTKTSYTITKYGSTALSPGMYYYYIAPIAAGGKSTNKNMLYSFSAYYY